MMEAYPQHCEECGKRISDAQAIGWFGKFFCLDCILYALSVIRDDDRLTISKDYLQRLRDGVV